MKRLITILIIICSIFFFASCKSKEENDALQSEETTEQQQKLQLDEPTEDKEIFIEPAIEAGCEVTFNCKPFPNIYVIDNEECVKLSDVLNALDLQYSFDEENREFAFCWRKQNYKINIDTIEGNLLCDSGKDILTPVYKLCDFLEIGIFYDEEYDHLYITPAAGNWELPQGYNVPVMMYHGVSDGSESSNLFVTPENLEDQIEYLLDNGFTPIWFEDLWHVEDFEKPVILTFDDGWGNNYTNLFPILQKYNVKATINIVCREIEKEAGNHMSVSEMHEMYDSGLVMLESHSMTHGELMYMTDEEQDAECINSKVAIIREFGYQPIVLCYPSGTFNKHTVELVDEYYRFGLIMCDGNKCYNTSDNTARVCRYFLERSTTIQIFEHWLEKGFPEIKEVTS